MRVRSLFFAAYRDLAGRGELEVELPPGATVSDLVAVVRGSAERLAGLPAEPVVAVNQEYAGYEQHLRDGDEVAFIPPVAGG